MLPCMLLPLLFGRFLSCDFTASASTLANSRGNGSALAACLLPLASATADPALRSAVASDCAYLGPLFELFHRNPELSFREFETAKRLACRDDARRFVIRRLDRYVMPDRSRPPFRRAPCTASG